MLLPRGPAGHAIFTPTSKGDVSIGAVFFSLTDGGLARVRQDALLKRLFKFFAVAYGDLNVHRILGLALVLNVLYLLAEDLVVILLILVPQAALSVREDYRWLCCARTYG